jgi:hypothetical protein
MWWEKLLWLIAGAVITLTVKSLWDYFRKRLAGNVPKRQMEALRFLSKEPKGWGEARSHLEEELGLPRKTANDTLQELEDLGAIESIIIHTDTRPASMSPWAERWHGRLAAQGGHKESPHAQECEAQAERRSRQE